MAVIRQLLQEVRDQYGRNAVHAAADDIRRMLMGLPPRTEYV